MMSQDPKVFIESIKRLPPLMRQILNNEALVSQSIALGEKYKLTPTQETAMMAIERGVVVQDIPPAQIQDRITADLKLEPDTARMFARDFLGMIILPMEWFVGSVQPMIVSLGGDPATYLTTAEKLFPEVYHPDQVQAAATEPATVASPAPEASPIPEAQPAPAAVHPLLQNFEERMETPRGRMETLLRLTSLSTQIDQFMAQEKLTQAEGQEMLRQLDGLSSAINTRDLNPLELHSIKRRLAKVIERLAKIT